MNQENPDTPESTTDPRIHRSEPVVYRRLMGHLHRNFNERFAISIAAHEKGRPFLEVIRLRRDGVEWLARGGVSVRAHEIPLLETAIAELKRTLLERTIASLPTMPSAPATGAVRRRHRRNRPPMNIASTGPTWAEYAASFPSLRDGDPTATTECQACLREPCSPAHFEERGFKRDHFADFVSSWRNSRDGGAPPIERVVNETAYVRTIAWTDADGQRCTRTEIKASPDDASTYPSATASRSHDERNV